MTNIVRAIDQRPPYTWMLYSIANYLELYLSQPCSGAPGWLYGQKFKNGCKIPGMWSLQGFLAAL